MTRKRGGAKKGKKTKKKRNESRRRMLSRTEAERGIMRQVAEQVVDDALSSAHGVTAPTPQIAAQRRAVAMNRFDRAERGRGASVDDSSNVWGPFPDLSSQDSNVSMDQSSQGSPGGPKAMDISPKRPSQSGEHSEDEISSSPSSDKMSISPEQPTSKAASSSSSSAMPKPVALSRQTSPHRQRKQGTQLGLLENNGLSMSVEYIPSTGNIPGWFSGHVQRRYHVPLFGVSSFTNLHGGFTQDMYREMMNLLKVALSEFLRHSNRDPDGSGVIRFMEVYIHAHNGQRDGGCKICGKSDQHQGIRVESTIPSILSQDAQHLRKIGFDVLPPDFFKVETVEPLFRKISQLIPYYIIELINKNNMGQIIREILYSVGNDGKLNEHEGDNVLCIPLDYYKGRAAGSDPMKRPFGYHKDTVDNRTIYVNLSFDNEVPIYSASLIQCHTNDADSERCEEAIRFKINPFGTIGFSDFLLAHSTPTGLCSLGSDSSIVCGALGGDTTVSRSSSEVSGTVGVNIQNVHGAIPPASLNPDGSRKQWTVKFNPKNRGRLVRRDNQNRMVQILQNRPNFIRSWFTFFQTRDKSRGSGESKSDSTSVAVVNRDKYELAMLNHSNSIYGRPSGGSGPSPPPTHDLKFHPRSDSGQHTDSFKRWSSHLDSRRRSGGEPDMDHPDHPRHFFGIMHVNPDIHYMVDVTVKNAFEQVIALDDRLSEDLKTMTGGKRKKRKRKKRKGKKTKKRRSQKKRKRKRSRKQKKRKSKKKHT